MILFKLKTKCSKLIYFEDENVFLALKCNENVNRLGSIVSWLLVMIVQ